MKQQRGIALITALLIVALVTLVAVQMSSDMSRSLSRTAVILERDQARLLAQGVEHWAQIMLRRDGKDSQIDSLDEDWAQQLPPIMVEGGQVAGSLEDAQGYINLNNAGLSLTSQQTSNEHLAVLRRLLERYGGNGDVADAVVDWVDADSQTRFPAGAEDADYLVNGFVLPANARMVSVSELRAVQGVDATLYRALHGVLSALPAVTAINVNTAPLEVLQALDPALDEADLKDLVQRRQTVPFNTVDEVLQDIAFSVLDAQRKTVLKPLLAVASQWFILHADASYGDSVLHWNVLLHRTPQGVHTIYRSMESL